MSDVVLTTKFTLDNLLDSKFCEHLMKDKQDKGMGEVVLEDGTTLTMPVRKLIVNAIFWRVYRFFKESITKDRVFPLHSFNDETDGKCFGGIYKELVLKHYAGQSTIIHDVATAKDISQEEDKFYLEVLQQVFLGKCYLPNFIHKYLRPYQGLMDIISIAELFTQEPLKSILDQKVDGSLGTAIAEKKIEQANQKLHTLLADKHGPLKNNWLQPYMSTKLLKRNQLPQMFYEYGCRSDITDIMMSHVITASAISGSNNVDDYATESLSAKKSAFFNSEVIERAQYFARKCRLVGSQMPRIYPGWCGSEVMLEITLSEQSMKNYIGKIIRFQGSDVVLTQENVRKYVSIPLEMYSPFGCRHTDGVCDHCAGYMYGYLSKFVPPNIHIGVFSATKAVAAITQLILSAKHLIRTLSKEYNLPASAMRYLLKHNDGLTWNVSLADKFPIISIRIPLDAIGTLTDLTQKNLPVTESFTKIKYFDIVIGDKYDRVTLDDGQAIPYLSSYALMHMKKYWKQLDITSDDVTVPMADFDLTKPFFKYTVMNDDMVSFVARIENFLTSRIADYHSIPLLMRDFCKILYSKTDIEVFYVEMLLRGYMISNAMDYRIPVITDGNESVSFAGMSKVIDEAALSTKLSFEGLNSLFADPKPTTQATGFGMNDAYFGF